MSSTINTFTSNWFRVKHPYIVEEYVERINENAECLPSGECLTIHEHQGNMRITAFDMVDQTLGFYEDEEQEEWVDLEEVIAEMLEENEIFRITSISWFKGRLSSMFMSVYTWDGRQETRSLNQWSDDISQSLDIEPKRLDGWS